MILPSDSVCRPPNPDSPLRHAMVGGLSVNGKLLIVAAAMEPLAINALDLIARRRSIQGWPSGTAKDSEDTLRFSAVTGVRPMIEKYSALECRGSVQSDDHGKGQIPGRTYDVEDCLIHSRD